VAQPKGDSAAIDRRRGAAGFAGFVGGSMGDDAGIVAAVDSPEAIASLFHFLVLLRLVEYKT
jgi:hypothetical protein